MEATSGSHRTERGSDWRAAVITAVAPVAWGSTYYVTRHYLPADLPLTGAAIRALPAGLLLLALRPALPHGVWWWRTAVISVLTVGGFFVLIYQAGQRLPSGVAAILMASSALMMLLVTWALLGRRPAPRALTGAVVGLVGVVLLVGGSATGLDPWGVVASLLAMTASCLGFVLTVRWRPPVPPVTFVAWQLTAGGLMLLPVALLVEGLPPVLGGRELLGFGYVTLVATAVAYVAWFHGLDRLEPGHVGLIGLLNPVAGAALGVLLAGERFTVEQGAGMVLVLAGIVVGTRTARRTAARPHAVRAPEPA